MEVEKVIAGDTVRQPKKKIRMSDVKVLADANGTSMSDITEREDEESAPETESKVRKLPRTPSKVMRAAAFVAEFNQVLRFCGFSTIGREIMYFCKMKMKKKK